MAKGLLLKELFSMKNVTLVILMVLSTVSGKYIQLTVYCWLMLLVVYYMIMNNHIVPK